MRMYHRPLAVVTLCVLAAITVHTVTAAGQDLELLDDWKMYSDGSMALYRALAVEAFNRLDERERVIAALATTDDAIRYREHAKEMLSEAFGPLPERTPLKARTVETFTHENFTIENVIYESRPGFQVTGMVCKRTDSTGRLPAIIYVCGHTEDGFRSETYQHVILNLADKGFLVFAFDPVGQGERLQYVGEDGTSVLGGATREHSYAGLQYTLCGRSMAMVRLWDGIRAIDYLETRNDVDAKRIGVHGRSGGGTMSSFLGAMDDRIAAAAPECYIDGFRRLYESIGPQDAEQNLLSQIALGLDHDDFLIVRGKRPTLVVTTTRDFFSIQGARETVARASRVLSLAGDANTLSMTEDDAPHQSTKANREAVYSFFMHTFGVTGDTTDHDIPVMDHAVITMTKTGQAVSSGSRSIYEFIKEDATPLLEALRGKRKNTPAYSSTVLNAAKTISGIRTGGDMGQAVFCGRHILEGYSIELYLVPGENGIMMPVAILHPEGRTETRGTVLYLDPAGKKHAVESGGEAVKLVMDGYTVCVADIPGIGELQSGTGRNDSVFDGVDFNVVFSAQLLGRSVTGVQAGHILKLRSFLSAEESTDDIICVAEGTCGPAALHAATLDDHMGELILSGSILSWESVVNQKYYDYAIGTTIVPGALLSYDLPDLVCAAGDLDLHIISPVNGAGKVLSETDKRPFRDIISNFSPERAALVRLMGDGASISEAVRALHR